MTICSRPPLSSSRPTLPRILTAPRPVLKVLLDAVQAANGAAGGEIRPFDVLHQLLDGDLRVVNLRADAVNDFAQIVRGHVGGHADGDAGAAVDQQVGKGGGENGRLRQPLVVVGDKIHRVLVHVLHQGRRPGASCGPRCNAWRRADRLRRSRNCPARRPSVSRMAHGCAMWTSVG